MLIRKLWDKSTKNPWRPRQEVKRRENNKETEIKVEILIKMTVYVKRETGYLKC